MNGHPAAIVKSAEGRASGHKVPGVSAAMKVLAVRVWRTALGRTSR